MSEYWKLDETKYYRDANGLWRKRASKPRRLAPGTRRIWTTMNNGNIRVTVIEDRGAWVIVQADDGQHRVRPRNLHRDVRYDQAANEWVYEQYMERWAND